MDMDFMDPFRRRYPGLSVPSFAGHQPPPQASQYPYWNPLVAYYQHQHRAAAMMGQGALHLSKPAEPKPRLAKEEVELLEQEFAKNQKPSSSTKRELAEQMGVEVPRINNWFQNRRAKEKQMRKTAEFEAQQARERAASQAKLSGGQDLGECGGPDDPSDHQTQRLASSDFGADDDTTGSEMSATETEPADQAAVAPRPTASASGSPESADSDGFVHVAYGPSTASTGPAEGMAEPAAAVTFSETQAHHELPPAAASFAFRLACAEAAADGLPGPGFPGLSPHNGGGVSDSGAFSPFADQDYFATPSAPQFPSELTVSTSPYITDNHILRHQESVESLPPSDVSPASTAESPLGMSDLRFKSPPPPADIAGRRKSRRPAPLGLSSLRGPPGPKTGADPPRRADTVSPIRRISSATGSLCGRVQKSFIGPGGPRSPFTIDRNKEALLQSVHETHTPGMATLNSAVSPIVSEGMLGSNTGDSAVGTNASEDEPGYPFGSLGAVGGIPLYHAEAAVKSPPGTPGLQLGFYDAYFPSSLEQAWNYVSHDEPLPTPSLCSHGGSEAEFSMAPPLPGYVASQPVTPSFPPTMGPTYTGFFGASLGQAEYHFPESYPAESSARSSPVAPPRSKQFQFAQNVTPQDFNQDKP